MAQINTTRELGVLYMSDNDSSTCVILPYLSSCAASAYRYLFRRPDDYLPLVLLPRDCWPNAPKTNTKGSNRQDTDFRTAAKLCFSVDGPVLRTLIYTVPSLRAKTSCAYRQMPIMSYLPLLQVAARRSTSDNGACTALDPMRDDKDTTW